ncbi:MAG TPA: hypothetical protein VN549_03645 [Negativicutes bacterium]|nr:hypothetical protein [Negativicutes bacterium]
MKTITIECPNCNGTGLYQGMAERDNCAVVCHTCKGTGKTEYSYNEFTGRKTMNGVKRVFTRSCGYVHTAENIVTAEGQSIKFEDGGCTYEEWLNGTEPKPVKDLYCPYIWDNRGMGNEPLEDCKIHCKGFGSISNCEIYHKKAECWAKLESIK